MNIKIKELDSFRESFMVYLRKGEINITGTQINGKDNVHDSVTKLIGEFFVGQTYDDLKYEGKLVYELDTNNKNLNNPMVIVFYVNNDFYCSDYFPKHQDKIIQYFENNNINVIPFFMNTELESRVECINPILITDEEYDKVRTIISDLEKLKNKENE